VVEHINKRLKDYRQDLGFLKISVDELLDILSEKRIFEGVKFEAETDRHKFVSLDDMKNNKELLVGRCKIVGDGDEFGWFQVDFSKTTEIWSFKLTSEKSLSKLDSLSSNLRKYRKSISIFRSVFLSKFFLAPMFASAVFLFIYADLENQTKIVDFFAIFTFLYMIFCFVIFLMVLVLEKFWLPITISKNTSFWSRNKDDR